MDDEVRNFGVRVMASGVKSYFVRYRVGGGRRAQTRRATLGRHPEMTPEKARQAAKTILAEARLGADPAATKAAKRQALTVAELIDEWSAGAGKRNRSGKMRTTQSFEFDKARLANHVTPVIGALKLPDLRRGDIERTRDMIANGSTAKTAKTKSRGVSRVTGGEGAATRTLRIFSVVLSYAVERGYIVSNPALGVRKTPDGHGQRFLSATEMKALGAALQAKSLTHPSAIAILKLLSFTGCRKREIEALRWSEVDLSSGFLRLKTSKTGAKHVWLSQMGADLISDLPRIEGGEWVFPGTRGDSFYQGTPKVWREVRKSAGLSDVRMHDLRHTFASVSLAEGASIEVVSALLGHKERRTTERYAHLASNPIRDAVNKVADAIGEAFAPTKPASNQGGISTAA
jgi:integrase